MGKFCISSGHIISYKSQSLSFEKTTKNLHVISFLNLIPGDRIRMELGCGSLGGKRKGCEASKGDCEGGGGMDSTQRQGGKGADLLIIKFHKRCKKHLVKSFQIDKAIWIVNKQKVSRLDL